MGSSADAASVGLAGLSTRLTEAITSVDLQRSALEEIILSMSEHAQQLSAVATVLMDAAHTQGAVLQELQQLLSQSGAPSDVSAKLQPAASGLARATAMLGAP